VTRLLEELARYKVTDKTRITAEDVASAVASAAKRSALHFVLTGLEAVLESEITKLIDAQKLVVLHVPAGTRVNLDCPVRHYPIQ
jgi:hypothetical protein